MLAPTLDMYFHKEHPVFMVARELRCKKIWRGQNLGFSLSFYLTIGATYGFTLLTGYSIPFCDGPGGECWGSLGAGIGSLACSATLVIGIIWYAFQSTQFLDSDKSRWYDYEQPQNGSPNYDAHRARVQRRQAQLAAQQNQNAAPGAQAQMVPAPQAVAAPPRGPLKMFEPYAKHSLTEPDEKKSESESDSSIRLPSNELEDVCEVCHHKKCKGHPRHNLHQYSCGHTLHGDCYHSWNRMGGHQVRCPKCRTGIRAGRAQTINNTANIVEKHA